MGGRFDGEALSIRSPSGPRVSDDENVMAVA
jgi:hypothetical protein